MAVDDQSQIIFSIPQIESSRVWTFVVGVELAVQSQQHRTTAHDTHSCRNCWNRLVFTGEKLFSAALLL